MLIPTALLGLTMLDSAHWNWIITLGRLIPVGAFGGKYTTEYRS